LQAKPAPTVEAAHVEAVTPPPLSVEDVQAHERSKAEAEEVRQETQEDGAVRVVVAQPVVQEDVVVATAVGAPKRRGAVFYKNASEEFKKKSSNTHGFTMWGVRLGTCHVHRQQRFVVPRKMKLFAFMGGGCLDLSKGIFVYDKMYVTLGVMWGGCKVIVPPGIRVVCKNGIGICGGFRAECTSDDGTDPELPSVEDMPVLYLKGASVWAGARVIVNHDAPPLQILYSSDEKQQQQLTQS